jgi:crossover junction endodeoxyribonuclease RuvC
MLKSSDATTISTASKPTAKVSQKRKKDDLKVEEKLTISVTDVVVGIDLSLTGTGWCVLKINQDGQTDTRKSGVVASKLKGMARLNEILEALDKEIPAGAAVYIENYGFGSKGQVVYQGELGGIVRYHLWKKGIKYTNVPPTVAKKWLTGKGVCEKSLILKELFKKYKIDLDDDNEADATVLALIGKSKMGRLPCNKSQQELLDKLEEQK